MKVKNMKLMLFGILILTTMLALLVSSLPAKAAMLVYDDADPAFTYTGAWITDTSKSQPYLGTTHYSIAAGAKAEISITGNQVTVVYTKKSSRTILDVYIVNSGGAATKIGSIDQYDAITQYQQEWTSPTFAPGTYTLRLVHAGPNGKYVDVDAVKAMTVTTYDDADPGITYTGPWIADTSKSQPYLGTTHYSIAAGAKAEIAITGDQVSVIYTKKSSRTTLDVYLVNSGGAATKIGSINQYDPLTQYQQVWTSPSFAAGTYTLRLVHAGPDGRYVDIDAIKVMGGGSVADTTPPAAITNLSAATGTSARTIDLSWTAPGDDGNSGKAVSYEIRFSTSGPITNESEWEAASPLPNPVIPESAGTTQTQPFGNMTPGDQHWFAIKTEDDAENVSGLSNSPSAYPPPPPANDNFASATVVASLPFTDTLTPLLWSSAGKEGSDPLFDFDIPDQPGCNTNQPGIQTIWYSFTPAETRAYNISTLGSSGSIADPIIGIWQGAGLSAVTCNDDARLDPSPNLPRVITTLNAGTTYYIEIVQFDTSGASLPELSAAGLSAQSDGLQVTISTDVSGPDAITDLSAETGDVSSAVDLSWTVPGGGAAGYTVKYHEDPIVDEEDWTNAYTITSGVPAPGSAGTTQGMTVSELEPGATYYFAVKSNDAYYNESALSNSPSATANNAVTTTTFFDDSDPAFTYTGTWIADSSKSEPYMGTTHYSTTAGAKAEIPITGNQVMLYYTKKSSRTSLDVYIVDAGGAATKIGSINQYDAITQYQQVWISPTFAQGSYTLRLVHAGPTGKYVDIDALGVMSTDNTFDDADPAFTYTGAWIADTSKSEPYMGTTHYSTAAGAKAEISITGNQVAILYTKKSSRTILDVYIVDAGGAATKIGSINQYDAITKYQQVWLSPTFAEGSYTLRLVHAGPTGKYVDIDAVVVLKNDNGTVSLLECTPVVNASFEAQVVALINQERAKENLPALTYNAAIASAARKHSTDMACNNFMDHTGSDGSDLGVRLTREGYA